IAGLLIVFKRYFKLPRIVRQAGFRRIDCLWIALRYDHGERNGGLSMNILLAMDDSPHSDAALQAVLSRPWPEDSNIHVISVVEPFHPEYAGWHTSYVPLALEAQKELLDATKRLVEESGAKLEDKFGKGRVKFEVLEGYIKDKILETARE